MLLLRGCEAESPADLSLRRVLHPQPLVLEPGGPEEVFADVDAAELGGVEDVRHSDALEVVLLLDGGAVAEHDAREDLVTVDAVSK